MESLDGARSIIAASEEILEKLCDPCNFDGIKTEGNYFCLECKEYFCQTCKDSHARFKSFRGHKLVRKEDVSGEAADSQRKRFIVTCYCEHNLEANIYCEIHSEVMCQICKTVKHRKCMAAPVKDKSTAYVISMLNSVIQNAQHMRDEFKKFQQERESDVKTLSDLAEKCKEDIQAFKEELVAFVHTLEQKLLSDLDSIVKEENQNIEFQNSSCSATLNVLDEDLKLLEDAKNAGEKASMFASDLKVNKHLKDFQSVLLDFKQEVKHPCLKFDRNQKLIDIEKEIKTLGKIVVGKVKTCFLDTTVDNSSMVNIKLPDEKIAQWISGCVFMPDGNLILCDRTNKKIILLDSNFQLEQKLDLQDRPRDVSVVDNTTVVITMPDTKTLQYIKVLPRLQIDGSIVLDRKCWGICVEGSVICITCHDDLRDAEVRLLDISGNLLRAIPLGPKYKNPYYVAVSATTSKIYISDRDNSTVTCVTPDGNISFQYRDDQLKGPKGLCLDYQDNIIVCCQDSRGIHVIKSNGTKDSILTNEFKDNLQHPSSVAYRASDKTLAVGGWNDNTLLVLKLTS